MIDFNSREEVINKLSELKAENLSHVTIEQFGELSSMFRTHILSATDSEKEVIEKYLVLFHRPNEGNKCIFNNEEPVLSWGLVHGVGIDENTGLSWKCYHYFIINGVERKYNVTLQYHPDNYSVSEE